MTARQLIALLQKYDPESDIVIVPADLAKGTYGIMIIDRVENCIIVYEVE